MTALRTTWLREAFIGCALLAAAGSGAAADRFNLPEGPGRELIYGHCQTCHDLQSVEDSAGIRERSWNALLDSMHNYGMRISDDQRARILTYLATYLGPNPPAKTDKQETASAEEEAVAGVDVFNDTCIACHQEDGKGKAGKFPPLAGNGDLFLSRDFPALVVLFGIEGQIEVGGKPFKNAMPPFDFLSDAEIAAVLAYVRGKWGNDALRPSGMTDLSPGDVAKLREKEMSSAAMIDYRKSLLAK